ncbi:MAG: NUDIX hydrolase [Simkaniaceae bacterium]|nr:NUDIX hydrolase [Simkaniaceae bacterium]
MSYSNHSVASLIFNPDKTEILLIKRRDVPVWALPGGGIDQGESPEIAAIRETLEETGYHVDITRKTAEYSPINRLTRNTHVFECTIKNGLPTINDEIQDIRFFPIQNLPYHLPPPYPEWIHEALTHPTLIKRPLTSITYWTFFQYLMKHPILVSRFLLARIGYSINDKGK